MAELATFLLRTVGWRLAASPATEHTCSFFWKFIRCQQGRSICGECGRYESSTQVVAYVARALQPPLDCKCVPGIVSM